MIPDETAVRRVADELFITTDRKDWPAARALFGDGPIDVVMSSLVGFRYDSKLTRGDDAVRTHTP